MTAELTWIDPDNVYPEAYGRLHEIVRQFLADEITREHFEQRYEEIETALRNR